MWLFESYASLPWWLRYGVALLFIAISTIQFRGPLLAVGVGRRPRIPDFRRQIELGEERLSLLNIP